MNIKRKKNILVLADYYVPGIKGGGPIQSIKNITDNLHKDFNFYIITLDRDLGDSKPYNNITYNQWQSVGNANVFYLDYDKFSIQGLVRTINSIEFDVLYLNTFFGFKFGILPIILRRLKKIKYTPIVLAPRGQFSEGALKLKALKKNIYIKIFKYLNFQKNILWQATAKIEENDIKTVFGNNIDIKIARNLTANYENLSYSKSIEKTPGNLKIVFLSRITRKKNLKMAINLLKNIEGNVLFDIYGPIEDKEYWNECELEMKKLKSNTLVRYKGIIEHSNINEMFGKYHIFLFPTLGENFGHVISEAMIGGCPCILSDKTPWKGLEEYKVGWDIPLQDYSKYKQVLNELVAMEDKAYCNLSQNSFEFAKNNSNRECIDETKKLFEL